MGPSLTTGNSAIDAAHATGMPPFDDIHAPEAPLLATFFLDTIIDNHGERQSTNRAFLPAKIANDRCQRLKICVNTLAKKLEFASVNGNLRVIGVYFQSVDSNASSEIWYATARKEVIICSGWLGSPHLLMLRYWF